MIDAKDFTAAVKVLRGLDDVADPVLQGAEHDIALVVADNVRAAARRHRRTGKLERSIGVKVTGSGASAVTEVTAGGPMAVLLVTGARPHVIRARSHALAIHRGGSVVGFADSVRHRGFRPDPFVERGVEASLPDIDRITAAAGDAIADELAGRVRRRR